MQSFNDRLKKKFREIYKKVVLDKTDNSTCKDSITDLLYSTLDKEDIKTAKQQRATIKLIDKYREDFCTEWKNYLIYQFREEQKTQARNLLRNKDLSGISIITKCYWGRTLKLNDWKDIITLKSQLEYGSHFWSSVFLENEMEDSNGVSSAFSNLGIKDEEFLNQAIEFIEINYKPVDFNKLQMFPGNTYLEEKALINLSNSALNNSDSHRKKQLEVINFINNRKL